MKVKVCKSCRHTKGQHSIGGCSHTYFNGQTCRCTVTRLPKDLDQFEDGEPLND